MNSRSLGREIKVGAPTLARTAADRWRVGSIIDGVEAFFSADVPLAANGDAWATAMLLPTAKSGATLRLEADLDERLERNFAAIQSIARRAWRFKGGRVAAVSRRERSPAGGRAMFFTCGVDSFYTLRKRLGEVDRLVFVRGLNINLVDLADEARFAPAREGIAAVAAALGMPVSFCETNLRVHPTFSRVGWEVTHVAAVAAAAHALAPIAGRFYLSSSETGLPLGTDPTLDPLWSSSAVEIVNDGSEAVRLDKIRAIADWPLVHRHLRVCWRSDGGALNCGTCRKCVGTQIRFEIAGARDRLETFPRHPLVALVDEIPWIERRQTKLWTDLAAQVRDARLVSAIERMIARRPSAIERLQARGVWMRRSAAGRRVRGFAKKLLVPARRPH
jgi:hypothetical protein